jgi:ABC-type branched-subunit amino acid transport system ATPase component/predicted MFS family arabinose efflux permease
MPQGAGNRDDVAADDAAHGLAAVAGADDADGGLAGLAGAVVADEEQRTVRARTTTAADGDSGELAALPGVGGAELSLGEGLRRGGAAIFVVLLVLNSLDELEGAVLAVLAPDIRDTFGISDGAIVFISAAAVAFTVLGAVPMGWLADRYRRGPIIGISSIVFGAMVLLSGFAVNAFMLFCTRFGAGIAKANTLPVHGSMLADAYPIGVRGRIGAVTSVVGRIFGVLSPVVVGSIAAAAGGVDGWRWAYYLLGIPVAVVALAAFLLPEPPRGQWEQRDVLDEVLGDDDGHGDGDGHNGTDGAKGAEAEAPIAIEAAFARLRGIRTLRTAVLGFAAIGFGLFTAPVLVNLFLEDRYDLDAGGRGAVASIGGLASLLVLPFVGRFYDRVYRDDPARALRLIGWLILPSALLTPLQFQASDVTLFVLLGLPLGVLLSAAFVMVGPLLQSIVPYRLRGLGASMAMISIFLLGATGGALLAAPLIDAFDPAVAVPLLLVPATVVGGLLIMQSARSVRDDLALVTAELREEQADQRRRRADPERVPVLQVQGVDFAYGSVPVLFDVGFEVGRGEVLALLGTNGAGKSTILRLVEGLATPSRGVIRLHGRTVTYTAPEQRVRLGIVSLAGGEGVFPELSVDDNLAMGAFVYRHDRADVAARIERSLALFPQLASRRSTPAGALSGGQQQVLALAMALLHDPEILLLDELSLGLAPAVVADLIEVVEGLRDRGLAMIVVEQSLNLALALADRAVFLEKGRIRFDGPAADLAERDDLVRAVFLGQAAGAAGAGTGPGA